MSSLLLQYSGSINNSHPMVTKSAGWIDRDERHIQIKDIINKAMSSLLLQYSSNINNSPPKMTK